MLYNYYIENERLDTEWYLHAAKSFICKKDKGHKVLEQLIENMFLAELGHKLMLLHHTSVKVTNCTFKAPLLSESLKKIRTRTHKESVTNILSKLRQGMKHFKNEEM